MSKILFVFTFIILAGLSTSHCASFLSKDSLDKNILKDLSDEWLVFDKKTNSYVPCLKTSNLNDALSVRINLEKYKYYNLNFIAYPGLNLFINNKIYYSNNTTSVSFVRFSLRAISESEFKTVDLITFYNYDKSLPEKICYIGHNETIAYNNTKTGTIFERALKKITPGDNIFMILFLIIILFFGIIKNKFPKKFLEFYDFTEFFIVPSPEDNLALEIFSLPSILFMLINALSCSLLLGVVVGEKETLYGLPYASFGGVLIITIITVMIYFSKYIYLKVFGGIFNLKQLIKLQFFELIKISLKLNLVCVPLALVLFYTRSEILESGYKYFIYSLILCGLFAVIRISFLIFKYSNFRNIYLFSYLCATEILPLIIIIKVILF